jgi:peroxiredoxin
LGLVLVCLGCGERAPRLAKGDAVPHFETTHLDGRALKFPVDYRGQIVALRFWADWCPYCENEMIEIEPVYRDLQAQGLSVLAINVGQSREVARRFILNLGVSYDVGLDESSDIARNYGVLGLPTTFIIDKHGKVRRKILGESDAKTLEALARELL